MFNVKKNLTCVKNLEHTVRGFLESIQNENKAVFMKELKRTSAHHYFIL